MLTMFCMTSSDGLGAENDRVVTMLPDDVLRRWNKTAIFLRHGKRARVAGVEAFVNMRKWDDKAVRAILARSVS